MTTAVAPARRGIRFGLLSLVFAVLAPLWLLSGLVLAIRSSGHDFSTENTGPDAASVAIYVFVVAGYLIVPLLFLLAIAFAIVAIVRNLRSGRIMGIAALVVIALFFVGVVVVIVISLQGLANT